MISKSGIAVALLASLVACGGEEKPAQDPSTTSAQKPVETQTVMTPAPVTEVKPVEPIPAATPEPPKEKPLSDNEILGYIKTANTGEVAMADIAKKQANKKDAKDFAAMMFTMHTDANTKEAALEKKVTSVKADDSHADTQKLKSDADGIVAKLKDAKGKDFDKVYIDSQVDAHQAVLAELDAKIVPAAQNEEVKKFVADTRKVVSGHLDKAKEIQKKLSGVADVPAMKPSTTSKSDLAAPAKAQATDLTKSGY